jgi:hypothetical protein
MIERLNRVMSATPVPDAILAARAAQQAEAIRRQKARGARLRLRRRHERRMHAMVASVGGVLFAGVLVSAFYLGVISLPTRQSPEQAGAASFAQTKTGQLLVPAEGGWCKTLSFDNTTGLIGNSKLVDCDNFNNNKGDAAAPVRGGSYNTFSDSFRKR